MNQEEAMNDFVRLLLEGILPSQVNGVKEGLQSGIPKKTFADLSEWYNAFEMEDKAKVIQTTTIANRLLIYKLLCLLDGISGYGRSEGMLTHYSLFVDAYKDVESMETGQYISRTKVNSNDDREHFLHYVFHAMMDAKENGE